MEKYFVKLGDLQKHWYGRDSWRTLLRSVGLDRVDDDPDKQVSIAHLFGIFGRTNALWALRALPKEFDHRKIRWLVCDLVAPALRHNSDQRIHDALEVARAYARYSASEQELTRAYETAWETLSPEARAYLKITTPEVVTFAVIGACSEDATDNAPAAANTAIHAIRKAEGDAAATAARVEQERIFRRWLQQR